MRLIVRLLRGAVNILRGGATYAHLRVIELSYRPLEFGTNAIQWQPFDQERWVLHESWPNDDGVITPKQRDESCTSVS